MSGFLFTIDGTDGTGKNTQATILARALHNKYPDKDIEMVSFPRYGTSGCTMVEKYLHGEFGMDPRDVDPYTASMLYTIDRVISFKNDRWGEVYRNGGLVVADRYYTSNMIHQGAKILMNYCTDDMTASERNNVLNNLKVINKLSILNGWIIDTEVDKIGLPKPDKIFWLIADKASNEKMLNGRANNNPNHESDIHEDNKEYLDYCRESILVHKSVVSRKQNYLRDTDYISSVSYKEEFIKVTDENSVLKDKESIHKDIFKSVERLLASYGIYPVK